MCDGVSLLRERRGGFALAPLDPFAVHTPMLWGFIFLCYIEHLTRTAGSLDKHAGTLCSRHQLNRAKGSREELPCGVKGQCPLRLPLYTKNSYFPCKSTKFEPEFRLNSGGFFFECVLYYMNEGSVRCKTDRNQTPPFRNDDAGEVGIVE